MFLPDVVVPVESHTKCKRPEIRQLGLVHDLDFRFILSCKEAEPEN